MGRQPLAAGRSRRFMNIFRLERLLVDRAACGQRYLEFLRVSSLSAGLYVLPADTADTQGPHAEDELYYIVSGRGMVQVGGEEHPVEPGTAVFVPARVTHRFHTITEELALLVFFAPAEGSLATT
jgi:mannose-6-phosphate isomerase-like protein (cupin superfamily)